VNVCSVDILMDIVIKSGFRGVTLTTPKGPLKVNLDCIIRSLQKCSSVNTPEYVCIELEVDDKNQVYEIEKAGVEAVSKVRDDVFLKNMRLKMSEEDVKDLFRPFKYSINIFPPKEGRDKPIVIGNMEPTLDFEVIKNQLDFLIENEVRLSLVLKCQRVWCINNGSWGLGWDFENAE
jgi:hypothetical protein